MSKLSVVTNQEILGKDFTVYGSVEEPLFLAKDVARWIDYAKVDGKYKISQMLATVDSTERVKKIVDITLITGTNNVDTTSTARKTQEMWFVTEDGLYEILMLSRKPIAKQFKSEVKKVLHQLRTKGGYITEKGVAALLDNPAYLMELVSESSKKLLELRKENEIMKPKADYYDQCCSGENLVEIGHLGKVTGIGEKLIFKVLEGDRVIRRKYVDGVSYYERNYQYKDYFDIQSVPFTTPDGRKLTRDKLMLTQEGLTFFVRKYGKKQITA